MRVPTSPKIDRWKPEFCPDLGTHMGEKSCLELLQIATPKIRVVVFVDLQRKVC
jgi:hypothetical protein